jgi:glucose/arabinose dehydrogenase
MRSVTLLALALPASVALAACGGSVPAASHPPAPGATASSAAPAAVPTGRSRVTLVVPHGLGGGPFATRRTVLVPKGWTARVWARVPGARMEAWTPEGDLLVSQPGRGRIVELRPGAGRAASVRTLLSGLTAPQGLAFARVSGRWVLYVGQATQIDRYPWGRRGISGRRAVVAAHLPAFDPSGDDVHPYKDIAVTPGGTLYFGVGSSSNASPGDLTMKPPRAVIMSVRPDGRHLHIVMTGVRNAEGLATAPDGVVWLAVNNRDNIPYPFHRPYGGYRDAFGKVIPAYVDNHPPDEVLPVSQGRDLGWPYCNPDQDLNHPAGSLADVPFVADALTNPGDRHLRCGRLPRLQVGLPAHAAPLGMSFLEGSTIPAPWSGGAVIAAHGSWDRQPPRSPAVLWLAWHAAKRTLAPSVVLITGFQNASGSRWGRPVDAVPGPDHSLYVTDDTAGAVYQFTAPR